MCADLTLETLSSHFRTGHQSRLSDFRRCERIPEPAAICLEVIVTSITDFTTVIAGIEPIGPERQGRPLG
jgi:hypothetical protein